MMEKKDLIRQIKNRNTLFGTPVCVQAVQFLIVNHFGSGFFRHVL